MFISDDEIAQRSAHPNNLANRATDKPRRTLTNYNERTEARDVEPDGDVPDDNTKIAPLHNGGRRPGDANLSAEVRAIVGGLAHFDTARNVAEQFGVSEHHVHELKHGMHSTAQGQDADLTASINAGLKRPHDIAVQKLTSVLLGIDTTRLNPKRPKDAIMVASGLARIAQQTNPIQQKGADAEGQPAVRLVIYAPTVKQENHYESVHAISPARER